MSSARRPKKTSSSTEVLPQAAPGASPVVMWGAIGVIALTLIYFLGVRPISLVYSPAEWAWLAWNSKNDTLHGRFIPFVFLVMAWLGWKKAKHEEVRPSAWGLPVLLIGIFLYLAAVRTLQPRLVLVGMPFLILGPMLHLRGWAFARHFIFPAFFWYFAIPVPQIQQASALLQVLITKLCYHTGVFFGMEISLQGNTIRALGEPGWGFDIAEACSGIRSLMALTMIAAVYANYTQKVLWKKAFLFACSLPLAIFANFWRIFTILVLAEMGYTEFARATYHDWAGLLIFFPLALTGLFLIDSLINRRFRRRKVVRKSVSVGPGGGDNRQQST